MLKSIKIQDIEIKLNYKFDNLQEPIKNKIFDDIQKWFTQKLDKYIVKYAKADIQSHLNFHISKNNKWLYDGNFNFTIWTENIIYKRENFKNILDLINHFFDHAKEQLSSK